MCIYSVRKQAGITFFIDTVRNALNAGGVIHCYCTELDAEEKLHRITLWFTG